MPTEEVRFGPAALKRAIAAADGRHPSSAPLVLRDPAETGLTIRVSGRAAGWYLKWNGKFKRLAGVGNPDTKGDRRESGYLYTGKDAAEVAGRVRELMKLGQDVDDYLAARSLGQSHADASATGASLSARREGAWTWAVLAERFIAEHVSRPKVRRNGSVKPEKSNTISEATFVLRHPDVAAALDKRLARDIRKADIEAIRDKWWDGGRGAKGRQQKLVAYVKSAMAWAKRTHSAAQLDDILPWWVELRHHRYASQAELAHMEGKSAARPLTAREVALLLHVAERNRIAPGRKIRSETAEVTLAALWWVALTAQRTHAAYQATVARVDDRTASDGWYDVSWLPADMKGGRHFSLAVPPEVYDRTVGRALLDPHRRAGSTWVFPMRTAKVRGKDEVADRPLNDTALNNLLGRLRGLKDAKKVADDQLTAAGLPHFTLHELRDALTTHLASHTDLPSSTASAILDHAAANGDAPETRESAVTRDHYNKSQRMQLKYAGLRAWAGAVITEYEAIEAEHRRERAKGQLGRAPQIPTRRAAERAQAMAERASAALATDAAEEEAVAPLERKRLNLRALCGSTLDE